jgi:hypothetical protein
VLQSLRIDCDARRIDAMRARPMIGASRHGSLLSRQAAAPTPHADPHFPTENHE